MRRTIGFSGDLLLYSIVLAILTLAPPPAAALRDIGPGMAPPPFSLFDHEGEKFSLAHFSGNPGALIFWSTWSPRSAEILEDFREYHREYSDHGLKIVAINVDGEKPNKKRKAQIRKYAEEMDLPFPVLFDEDLQTFASYGIMAHPSVVVLDRDGRTTYTLGGYPPALRDELRDHLLMVLGLYVEPGRPSLPSVGYVPKGMALQHYNLGRRLMAKGATEKALAAFTMASGEDPSFLEPSVMKARLLMATGDLDEAVSLIRTGDPMTINRGDLRYLLGMILLMKGNTEGAEKAFLGIVEKTPKEGWGQWGLGLVALARDDTALAVEKMREASALQPVNPEAEAYLRSYLVSLWKQKGSSRDEEDLVSFFPELAELRDRYRIMFGLRKAVR